MGESRNQFQFRSAIRSETGPLRKENQDSTLEADLGVSGHVLAVADGVGGHADGKRASAETLRLLESGLRANRALWPNRSGRAEEVRDLDVLIRQINRIVCGLGERSRDKKRMASTLTCAWLKNGYMLIGQVGDSRLYRFRDSQLIRLTVDQTEAGELFARGDISEEEERKFPKRNVIKQAIGGTDPEKFEPVITCENFQSGDRYLICSDGLTEGLKDKDIAAIMDPERESDLKKVVDTLVEYSLRNSGKDNTTAVVFEIQQG
ncbi:MAG: PP2C family serine/threonine-protein phosphatase [Puniceicoccaceae bacterium]